MELQLKNLSEHEVEQTAVKYYHSIWELIITRTSVVPDLPGKNTRLVLSVDIATGKTDRHHAKCFVFHDYQWNFICAKPSGLMDSDAKKDESWLLKEAIMIITGEKYEG